jgi:hypothetical protein
VSGPPIIESLWIYIPILQIKKFNGKKKESLYLIPRRGALNGWIMISFCQEMACLAVYSGFKTKKYFLAGNSQQEEECKKFS